MNKRGNVTEILFMGVFVVILAIIIVVASKIGTEFNTNFQNLDLSNESKQIIQENTDKQATTTDNMFIFIFIMFILILGVGVFLLNTHPVLFWVGVILIGFALIPIAILNNVFDEFATNSNIATTYSEFTLIDFIFSDFTLIITIICFIVIILLYSRTR